MKLRIITIISTILILGCSPQPKIVYVTAKCSAPQIPPEPHYPVYGLTDADKSKPGKVVKSYAASLQMCIGDDKARRKQLEGYQHRD